ncbi:MAG: acetylxylan esterase [Planctomycetia bacterium]|nr:acetylxylan esterase [Planctomycetia bacterium]
MSRLFRWSLLSLLSCVVAGSAAARAAEPLPPPNYDETLAGGKDLPDPLTCVDGTKVKDADAWRMKRRPELLNLFRAEMHGHSPARPKEMKFEETSFDDRALNGLATRKEITIRIAPDAPPLRLLLYVPNRPNALPSARPVLLGVNFDGNHTIDADPGITIVDQWVMPRGAASETLEHPAESTRGSAASRWQVPLALKRGYAVATISRADVEPDYATGWKHGIRGYYLKKSGRAEFLADDWGAVAAWAWSLSRALDYLETDTLVDAKRVLVHGHSRLGKASVWAGAEDERFAAVVVNNSGEGGAALARRNIGETTYVINNRFPHWFCGNYKKYSGHTEKLPFDAHTLVAMSAPRPIYIASAVEDTWADPRGEYLAAKYAEPVYALFAKPGLGVDAMPGVDQPVGDFIAYHIRTGKHDVTEYDWQQYLKFADRHFGK